LILVFFFVSGRTFSSAAADGEVRPIGAEKSASTASSAEMTVSSFSLAPIS
jgi:hypothetical protein